VYAQANCLVGCFFMLQKTVALASSTAWHLLGWKLHFPNEMQQSLVRKKGNAIVQLAAFEL